MDAEFTHPESLTAMLIAAELVRVLNAEPREKRMPERLVYATPDGACTITCRPTAARVGVVGTGYRLRPRQDIRALPRFR